MCVSIEASAWNEGGFTHEKRKTSRRKEEDMYSFPD